ncbi:hypothetical protein ACFOUP_07580 [Belliella kenyensis]|uniref:DUF4296 domain-containing protein n=1 Tax=Belliella kenyensis TaxID=1472724 RepID=A0ABV8ELL3_9BACT|nr:hypothetical protein [Belliella kenyensis]MCH7400334.1 hypothetical protein [Belliella kenyensis]MDN3604648.1 hypothetical protein [Belliella kenyensis]
MNKYYLIVIIAVLFGCNSGLQNDQIDKSIEELIIELENDILDGEYSFSKEERQTVIDLAFHGSSQAYLEELKKVKEELILNPKLKEVYKNRLNGLEQKEDMGVSSKAMDDVPYVKE